MSDPGTIIWTDLTVENAEEVRDFYSSVVGWTHEPEDMGDYEDYHMVASSTGDRVAGVCHPRGVNADLPPQWLVYISVEDLDASMAACQELGGRVVAGPKKLGPYGRYCVIEDPAGAVAALGPWGASAVAQPATFGGQYAPVLTTDALHVGSGDGQVTFDRDFTGRWAGPTTTASISKWPSATPPIMGQT